MKARTQDNPAIAVADCRHHWVLGAPQNGEIKANCRNCGGERVYPAVLDDLDPRPSRTTDSSQAWRRPSAGHGRRPSPPRKGLVALDAVPITEESE